jgi:hypothetical protein
VIYIYHVQPTTMMLLSVVAIEKNGGGDVACIARTARIRARALRLYRESIIQHNISLSRSFNLSCATFSKINSKYSNLYSRMDGTGTGCCTGHRSQVQPTIWCGSIGSSFSVISPNVNRQPSKVGSIEHPTTLQRICRTTRE